MKQNTMALARRFRPSNFETMVGQEASLRALMHALDTQRLHHAYLFTGTRGVGKTSLARILAKCLNCETGISSKPCGHCSACVDIDEGRFVDLIEVDAASRTKVEDTRELLDNVQYLPTRARFKIYLIDEVHMLSGHSFNALLKTLEEPPPHVKFLLATTDPQKLPMTILSRCLQFHLKRVPLDKIQEHLSFIAKEEKVFAEKEALLVLANAADGSLRDALSLLDQAIAYGNGRVLKSAVHTMLGLSETAQLIALLQGLYNNSAADLFSVIQALSETVPDFQMLLTQFLGLLHQIAILQQLPEAIEESHPERETLLALAKTISPEEIQLFYQIGLIGQRDLPYAPSPKMGFEMVLLRMLAFQPVKILEEGVKKGDSHLRQNDEKARYNESASKKELKPLRNALSVPASVDKRNPNPKSSASTDNTPFDTPWADLIQKLNLTGLAKVLAEHCTLKDRTEDSIHLILEEAQKPLLSKRHEERLEEALKNHYKKPMRLKISIGISSTETPALQKERQQQEIHQTARQTMEQDPTIQQFIKTFNAKIETVTVHAKADDDD